MSQRRLCSLVRLAGPWTLAASMLALGLSGCERRAPEPQAQRQTPFVFQALNLRQQDPQGRLQWRVSSPEARYDLTRRVALARQLRGEIHTNGQALYRLQASHGTVLSDGDVIQLEGAVTVQRLGADPVTIQASRMRWYPRQQRLELDRRAEAFDPSLRLTATKATLLLDRDLLQLRGNPQLQTRQPVGAGSGPLRLRLQQVDWSPGNGRLLAAGPVLATGQSPSGARRSLQAAGLQGNTLTRQMDLLGPVRLMAADQRASLQAQTTSLDLRSNTLSSAAPFQAAIGPLQISGSALRLNLASSEAVIPSGCSLVQPGASLSAGLCSWNWQNDEVNASGGVLLQRQANRQTTRAQRLRGRIGANGLLVFSSPGSRVRSTLVLPQGKPAQTSKAAAIRL